MGLTRTIEWKFSAGEVVCFKTDVTQNTRMTIHMLEANVCDADEVQRTYIVRATSHQTERDWTDDMKPIRATAMVKYGVETFRVRETEIVAYVPKETAEPATNHGVA